MVPTTVCHNSLGLLSVTLGCTNQTSDGIQCTTDLGRDHRLSEPAKEAKPQLSMFRWGRGLLLL